MLTSSLISLVQQETPDVSRIKIMTILDEIQKMVFTQSTTAQMRIIDPTTGMDPILVTTSGTYSYNINTTSGFPVDAWRVEDIYTECIDQPVEEIITFEATPAIPYARVIFPKIFSPSGKFYVRCYRFPTSITAESIQLEIPSAYHLSHVYEGLLGFIEQMRSGKSERYTNFVGKILPDLIRNMSKGKRRNTSTPYRPAGT
jgi:hypothetical protein